MPASSCGRPHLPAGVRPATASWRSGNCLRNACVISVVIQPGKMALTWMFSFAHPVAQLFVYWTTPPLLAAYAVAYGLPKMDIIEPMLMTLPRPRRWNCGWARVEQL